MLRFKSVKWTQASLKRVLEIYTLAKREAEHEHQLKVKYSRKGVGAAMRRLLDPVDPGSLESEMMCPKCFGACTKAKVEGKCLLCGESIIAVERSAPTCQIEAEGIVWQLVYTPDGITWQAKNAGVVTKDFMAMELGDYATTRRSALRIRCLCP